LRVIKNYPLIIKSDAIAKSNPIIIKPHSMSYVKIWIHAVWATKNREPFLSKQLRRELFPHIIEYAKTKNIYITCMNGYTDHVHCLFAVHPEQNIAKIIKLMKGESSFWINRNQLCSSRFEWQNEYSAFSVSESKLSKIKNYIRNQEKHHMKNKKIQIP
jgi:REP element-mobilizing transposase RayT